MVLMLLMLLNIFGDNGHAECGDLLQGFDR